METNKDLIKVVKDKIDSMKRLKAISSSIGRRWLKSEEERLVNLKVELYLLYSTLNIK